MSNKEPNYLRCAYCCKPIKHKVLFVDDRPHLPFCSVGCHERYKVLQVDALKKYGFRI